jgi:protein-disulfide isomerase
MKNKKLMTVIITIGLLIVAYFVAASFYKEKVSKEVEEKSQKQSELFVREYSAKTGPESARVTIVEFLDPECESCRQFYPYVKEILRKNKDKVQLVIRYAPFHPNSEFAVRIIEAARLQGKYWEALELLFKYQPQWGSHHDPKPELIWEYLPELSLDVEKLKQDMNDPRITSIIKQDILDAKTLDVRATPTFFINGKPLEKFGLNYLQQAVENEL